MNTKVTEPIIEIYLEHLRQGNIETARLVREELDEWEKRAEQQYLMHVSPAPKILPTNDKQKALNEILNDGKIRKYCDYRGHEKLTGFNPMFVKKVMIHRYGLDFCSRACREAYAEEKGYKDGNQQYRLKEGQWALKYDKCIVCSTTERKHMGKGKCSRCYFNKMPVPGLMETKEPYIDSESPTAFCANTACPSPRRPFMKKNMFQRNELYFCSKRCRDTDV